jgi:hypothetical protein
MDGRRAPRAGGLAYGPIMALALVMAVAAAGAQAGAAHMAELAICESASHPAVAARLSSGISAALSGRAPQWSA